MVLTCDGLVSHPERVNDPHPFNTMETNDKHRPYVPSWHEEGFNLTYFKTNQNFIFFIQNVYQFSSDLLFNCLLGVIDFFFFCVEMIQSREMLVEMLDFLDEGMFKVM